MESNNIFINREIYNNHSISPEIVASKLYAKSLGVVDLVLYCS